MIATTVNSAQGAIVIYGCDGVVADLMYAEADVDGLYPVDRDVREFAGNAFLKHLCHSIKNCFVPR